MIPKTAKDAAVVTTGMGISTVLAAVSIFLIARLLGPYGFGLYVAALGIVTIVIDSVELAISGSIVKFASKADQHNQAYLKFGFLLKLFLGLGMSLLFVLLSPSIAGLINPDLQAPLLVSAWFIPAVFLQRFPRSLLQSQKRFLPDITIEVATNLFRLVFIGWYYYANNLTVVTALLSYLYGAILAFLLGSLFISWKFLSANITSAHRRHFFAFQKWLTLAFIVAAIHGRIDTALVIKLSSAEVSGIYQAAYRFFMPAIQFAASLSLIFAPRFAGFTDNQTSRIYLFKAAKLSLLLSLLVLLIIPLAPFAVNLIFGSHYQAATLPVKILSFGFTAFVASAPFTAFLIYSANKTKTFFQINLIQLILLVGLEIFLVPRLNAVGAAIASTSTLIVVNLLIIISALRARHES